MATRKLLYLDPIFGAPSELNSTDTAQAAIFKALGNGGIGFDASGNTVANVAAPVAPTDAANKAYVDGIAQGVSVVGSVKALSNANVSLTGTQTIDGVSLNVGDRVLLTAQTNAVQNGIFIVQSGAWTRPTLADDYSSGRAFAGLYTYVESGNNFAAEQWAAVGAGTGKVDTDPSSWTQLTGAAEITAGNGLQKSAVNGNTMSVVVASPSGLQFTGGALDTQLNAAGGLTKDSNGLAAKLNSNATLAVDAQGLRVLGVPNLFTVAGTATSSTVTAPSLNTLTAGSSSLADSLHQHTEVLRARATGETLTNGSTPLAAGDVVQWSSTADTMGRCDAASSTTAQCFGVSAAAVSAGANGLIIRRGIAPGVLSQATPGSAIFLAVGGGLTATRPTAAGAAIVRIGTAKNASDLEVNIVFVGQLSAS